MKRESIDKIINKLNKTFEQYDRIVCVMLFGSYNTEYFNQNSDLDFAVIYDGHVSIEYELSLEVGISKVLGTDNIDVVNLNKKPLTFKHKVISTSKIIYEKDYVKTSDFLEDVLRYYCDQEYDIRALNKEYDYSLKESYLND